MAKKTVNKIIANESIAGKIETIMASMKKKESVIGFVTAFVLVAAVIGVINKSSFKVNQNNAENTAQNSEETAAPSVTATSEAQKLADVQPTPTTVKKIAEIKVLADTLGNREEVVAKKGDSFARISKRMCGSEKFSLQIKQSNGYARRSLQIGDVIEVNCSQ